MSLTELGKRNRKLEHLATQLAIGNTHLHFFRKINQAWKEEFAKEIYLSKDFWGYTLSGQIQAAILCLCRVYDVFRDSHQRPERDAYHLLRFVQEINESFSGNLTANENRQIQQDLEFLGKDNPAPAVKKLRKWRNNFVAHQNADLLLGGREGFLKDYPVDLEEIQDLFEHAFSILERWAYYCQDKFNQEQIDQGQIKRFRFPKIISGKDDYLFVLNSLRLGLQQRSTTPNSSQTPGLI